jgi:hypothetical protein
MTSTLWAYGPIYDFGKYFRRDIGISLNTGIFAENIIITKVFKKNAIW